MQCRTPKKIPKITKKYTVELTGLVYESGSLYGTVTIDGTRHPSGTVASSSPQKETLEVAEGTEIDVGIKNGSATSSTYIKTTIYLNNTQVAYSVGATYTFTITANCKIEFGVSSGLCYITMPYTS